MANTPYGRGPYGAGRYGGFPGVGRPYGVGAYGVGLYSRYGATIFDLQAVCGVVFAATVRQPAFTMPFGATSGVTFDAWSAVALTFMPEAISGIVFSLQATLTVSWDRLQPCESGTWQVLTPPMPYPVGAYPVPAPSGAGRRMRRA